MKSMTLRNNPDQHRYELLVDGQVVCLVEYAVKPDGLRLQHTEVVAGNEGKGYGSAMAQQLLDELTRRQQPIMPRCEFLIGYLNRHPEYAALVKAEQ